MLARLTRPAGLITLLLVGTNSGVSVQIPQFHEATAAAGVGQSGFSYSHAWGDYDGDGLDDLFVTYVFRPHILYRNLGGGVFENVSAQAGIGNDSGGEGAVWADYDNDGDLDLFVANGCKPIPDSPNVLYRNNGDGTFTKVTEAAGLFYLGNTEGTAWADYDLDGSLDLYVGLLSVADPNPGNFLYRSKGDGTFVNVSASAGVDDARDSNGGVEWADYDNDGDLDLYVANRNQPNRLYRNNRDGTFTDVATAAGVAAGGNSEGVAWGDYDNDGWLDLYVASASTASQLYHNNRDGTFTNVAATAHVELEGINVGANWADFDNNGWLDLFVVNLGGSAPNRLYRNNADGTFSDVAAAVGLADQLDGRVGGWADVDNDGFLDLFVSNDGAQRFFRNAGNTNHWLAFRLVGAAANRDGIGARVEASAVINGHEVRQIRELAAGGSRHSENSLRVEFGLGDATTADVTVTFPGGVPEHWGRVQANELLVMPERVFTDVALTASSSTIRASHITELRQRIDALRALHGLAAFHYTDSIKSRTTVIRAAHITELREALNDVYMAVGRLKPAYTDPDLAIGTTIKAVHIAELRAAVVALE
jgi:hypothetical protein